MIVDCARCGDPLLADMPHCGKCGGANPSFVSRKPDSFWDTDLGVEAGLFFSGVYGLFAGLAGILPARSTGLRSLAVLCAVLGAASLVAFHRVHASELSRAAKWTLRGVVLALLFLYGMIRDLTSAH